MNKRYSFLQILEGITKFNVIFFTLALFFAYFNKTSAERIYQMYEEQAIIIFFSILFGKIYQKIDNYKFFTKEIKLKSLFTGYTVYVVGYLLLEFLFTAVNGEELRSKLISLLAGWVYWVSVIWLSKNKIMDKLVRFLHGTLDYKNIFQLFVMFNIAFFMLILVMVSVGMLAGRSLFESIFIIIYFEAAFLIFHVVIAKAFDYIWNAETFEHKKISILGLYFASILYVTKLNVIDETLLGIASTKNNMSLFAVLTLILFWTFFAILFHFELKYPIRRR